MFRCRRPPTSRRPPPARFVVTGPYREVRSGRAGRRDVGGAAGRCDERLQLLEVARERRARRLLLITDTSDGARCVPAASSADQLADQVRFVFEPKTVGTYDVFVALVPHDVRSATIGMVGGTLAPLADVQSPLVFVGSPQPPVAYLKLVTADGSVECGRGAISTVDDLRDATLTVHVIGSPWSC